jgi:hypothetical protein
VNKNSFKTTEDKEGKQLNFGVLFDSQMLAVESLAVKAESSAQASLT